MTIVLYNGERKWTASHSFKKMIDHAEQFDKYIVDFEYILVSVNDLEASKIKDSNTLIDNILLADKKRTREAWTDLGILELVQRIRSMEQNDLNEWITWFSNVIRELNEGERRTLIQQLREGDEKAMCSSFGQLLDKEKAEGKAEGRAEGKAEGRTKERAEAVIELLEEIGEPSQQLREYIMEQTELEILRKWHRAAAKAESIEDFEQAVGLAPII